MVDETDKALISLGVLVGAAILSAIIAKVVDICYDRASISDDASDISEHTRNLIRARLTVMKFRNKKPDIKPKTPLETETEKQQNAVKVFRIWSAKSKMRTKPDVESANFEKKETKLELEDVGDDNTGGVKPSEITSGGESSKRDEQQNVEIVNETLPAAPVILETNTNTIRPKSALKKPKPSGATTTNTAGATTVLGEVSPRPTSGVKRVTIAEPESHKTDSVNSRGESTPKESISGQSIQPDNTSDKSPSSQRSETAESSSSIKSDKQTPNTSNSGNNTAEERLQSLQDGSGKTEQKKVDLESETSSVPQAWNDGQGSRSSGSTEGASAGSKSKKNSTTGTEGWRKTYVLYRGDSDDLLVPFDTKKKKSKPKRKGKKGKGK